MKFNTFKKFSIPKSYDLETVTKFHHKKVRYLKLLYIFIIVMILSLFAIDSLDAISFPLPLLAIHIIRITGMLLAFLLILKGKYYSSIYVAFVLTFATTVYGAITLEDQNTFPLLFFPMCAIMFYLTKRIIINILFTIFSTIALIYIYYYQATYQNPMFDLGIAYSIILIMGIFFAVLAFFVYEFRVLEQEITEQNQILLAKNTELQKNNEKLKESNEFVQQLLSVIAHDLRNPFNNIIGFSTLLYKNIDMYDKKKQADFLTMIVSSSEIGYGILENLLSLARSQYHKIELKLKNFTVLVILKEILAEFEIQLHQKEIKIDIKCGIELEIETDKNLFSSIIRNLLSNAIKFSPRQSIIEVIAKEIDDTISISVTNTGEIISEAIIQKILDRNWQFSSHGTEGERGSGLGLTICLDFTERLKGTLNISTDKKGQNSFTLTIPKTHQHVKDNTITS